ncbi:MAG: glycosyltransferase family 2 protein [Gammaproteobacteria bacterium]
MHDLLASLRAQTWQDFEVIIVDQSGAAVRELNEQVVARFGHDLRVRHIIDSGTGLSRARNIGLRLRRGRLVAFPDDDCWYAADILERVVEFFRTHPGYAILSGQYSEPGKVNPAFPQDHADLSQDNVLVRSSSVGIFLDSAKLLVDSLYFDERLGAGADWPAAEESDLLLRLLSHREIQGHYDAGLVVFHKVERRKFQTAAEFVRIRAAYWYVIGKNYRAGRSEWRLIKGLVSCMVSTQPFGPAASVRALVQGYRYGRMARRSQTSPRDGEGSGGGAHS